METQEKKYTSLNSATKYIPEILKYWVGVHNSSDDVIIKTPYGVDVVLNRPAWHPTFPIGLVKTESESKSNY